MSKNQKRTRDQLYSKGRVKFQRMRIVIEIDVPDDDFYRETFNASVMVASQEFVNQNRGSQLILVTSEEV